MFNRSVGFLSLSLAIACCQAAPISLDQVLARRLPSLGHRNWIVVADSAYPLQVSPGVETIVVRDSQIEAVKKILTALKKTHAGFRTNDILLKTQIINKNNKMFNKTMLKRLFKNHFLNTVPPL